MGRIRPFGFALTWIMAGAAAGEVKGPGDVVRECFEGMRAGDLGKVRGCYAERAWALIAPGVPPMEQGGKRLEGRMQDATEGVKEFRIDREERTGDGVAVVSATMVRGGKGDERVRVVLWETGAGWRIDYPEGVQAPFVLDDWINAYWFWSSTFEAAKGVDDPKAWYEKGIAGVARGRELVRARPESITVLDSMASAYSNWMNGDRRREYAAARVRREASGLGEGGEGDRHPVLLDGHGRFLPAVAEELRYLKPYEGEWLEEGLSPLALAYAYHKRAQVVGAETGRRHVSLAPSVVDSRPALDLKNWTIDEWTRGREREIKAMGLKVPMERREMEGMTARTPWVAGGDPGMLGRAVRSYRMAARLAGDAVAEYDRHLKAYDGSTTTFESHRDEMRASADEAAGDADYLAAGLATGEERARLGALAAGHYAQAREGWMRMGLLYWMDERAWVAIGPAEVAGRIKSRPTLEEALKDPAKTAEGMEAAQRAKIDAVRAAAAGEGLGRMYGRMVEYCRAHLGGSAVNMEDLDESDAYVTRCGERMKVLEGMGVGK